MARRYAGNLVSFGRSIKSPSISAAFLLLLFLVVLFVSVWFERRPAGMPMSSALLLHAHDLWLLLIGCLAGGIAFAALGSRGWREFTGFLRVPFKDLGGYFVVILVLMATAMVWMISAKTARPPEAAEYGEGVVHYIQHDPGGIFAAFMGLLTVVGFAFTLHDLRQIRHTITSFPDLIDRLCVMLDHASSTDRVRMICYTPSLGYIALPESDFDRFCQSLTTMDGRKPRAEIICLRDCDLKEWHDLFVGRETLRGDVSRELAKGATTAAHEIIRKLTPEGEPAGSSPVKYLPFEFMPGYYFFFSSTRAVVVAPLNLPFPKGAPKHKQQSLPTVQMIGFETSDRGIIHDLQVLYASFKRLPSTFVAEVTEQIHAKDFKQWSQSPKMSELVQKLTQQFDEARGAKGEYAGYLDADAKAAGSTDADVEVMMRVMLRKEVRKELAS